MCCWYGLLSWLVDCLIDCIVLVMLILCWTPCRSGWWWWWWWRRPFSWIWAKLECMKWLKILGWRLWFQRGFCALPPPNHEDDIVRLCNFVFVSFPVSMYCKKLGSTFRNVGKMKLTQQSVCESFWKSGSRNTVEKIAGKLGDQTYSELRRGGQGARSLSVRPWQNFILMALSIRQVVLRG